MTDPKQTKKTKLEIGKELLTPIVEVLDYETALGKLFTKGGDLKDAAEIKLSAKVNLFAGDEDAVAREQERARQSLAYQQDSAAIKVLRQEPLVCKTLKEGMERIIETFDKRYLVCSHIFIPRAMIIDLINTCSKEVDPVTQRDLIMGGYVGRLKNAKVITGAGRFIFDIMDVNDLVGVDSTRCKKEVISEFKCIDANKDSGAVFFNSTIKLGVSDPRAVVWVKLPKKE